MRRAVAAIVVIAGLLTGCAGTPQARPVTAAEAATLGTVRYQNFLAEARSFTATVLERGVTVTLTGWVDYGTHTGAASATTEQGSDALVWNGTRLSVSQGTGPLAAVPSDVSTWPTDVLDPSLSAVTNLLAILVSLGADRPENASLLQQAGAMWLRDDEVDGTRVTVFAGPQSADAASPDPSEARTRYWVDADGVLVRFEVRLGDVWTSVDFGDAGDVRVPGLLG